MCVLLSLIVVALPSFVCLVFRVSPGWFPRRVFEGSLSLLVVMICPFLAIFPHISYHACRTMVRTFLEVALRLMLQTQISQISSSVLSAVSLALNDKATRHES